MGLRIGGISSLCAIVWTALPACAPQPQTHPAETKPIPQNARVLDRCSSLGEMLCGAVSYLSDEAGVERRSGCVAYETKGRRVEQCGSIPISQP
jgi:hypothetical protein